MDDVGKRTIKWVERDGAVGVEAKVHLGHFGQGQVARVAVCISRGSWWWELRFPGGLLVREGFVDEWDARHDAECFAWHVPMLYRMVHHDAPVVSPVVTPVERTEPTTLVEMLGKMPTATIVQWVDLSLRDDADRWFVREAVGELKRRADAEAAKKRATRRAEA